jgi:predicted DNA-binding transcriptional regulator AlpA
MIYQLEREHRFPSRIKLTEHAVRWIEHEVQQWLTSRVSSTREPA